MWVKIKKGAHSPFRLPSFHLGKTSETYEVMFDESCRYDLQGVDQLDWNKLFGWSYGNHHKNSIRVGWRYNVALDVIELSSYTYRDGIRKAVQIAQVPINKKFFIYVFEINDTITIIVHDFYYHHEEVFKGWWGYNLDLYFGGDEVAPHDIRVWLRRVGK